MTFVILKKSFFVSALMFGIMVPKISFAATGTGITYHGRLVDPQGSAVVSNSVQFKLQIRSPGTENCLLYEESQTKNLSQSNGAFSITLNDGTGTRLDVSGYGLEEIFSNRKAFSFSGGECDAGTTYTPLTTDGRKIQILFNDGTFAPGLWETVPAMSVNFVPMAIESMQVGGYPKEQLVRIADGVPTAATEFNSARWTELLALISGTSTQFVKPGSATFTSAPVWSGVPTTANDLTNKSYVDAQIASATLPDIGTAGTYTKVTTDAKGRVTVGALLAESDIPNLSAAGKVSGSALTSGIIAGSTAINSSGNITTSGAISGSSVSTTSLRIYDGTHYVQLMAPTLTGDLTFKLPSTIGGLGNVLTTDGAGNLSWQSSSAAVASATLTDGNFWVGNGSNVPTAVSMSGDATMTNTGVLSVDKTTTAQNNKILALDGSGGATVSSLNLKGAVSGTVAVTTQGTTSSYTLRYPAAAPAVNQLLEVDASGNFSWINKSSINDSSKLPLAGGTMTGDIDMDGHDIQNVYLASSAILVGNASNRMTPMLMSGDVTLSNTGAATVGVDKITSSKILDATILGTDMDFTGAVNVNSSLVMKDNAGKFSDFLCATAGHVPVWSVTGWTCKVPASSLSSLIPATAFNSIDNLNFAQVWNWSTITNGYPMVMTANALTTGSVIKLTSTSNSLNSTNGLLNVANTGTSTSGLIARFQANSTFNSGVTMMASGRVGIGTINPNSKLHINDTGNSGTLRSVLELSADETVAGTGVSIDFSQAGTVTGNIANLFESNSHVGMSFSTYSLGTLSEKMRVSAKGTVGIGVTVPEAALDVAATGAYSSILIPRDTTGNRPSAAVNGMIRYNSTTELFEFYQNGGWVNYTNVSDARLKTDVAPVTRGLNIVNQLNPVFFNWDQNSPRAQGLGQQHEVGFLAQEVEQVLPEVVRKGADGYRSVEYGKIVAVAVAAVKELYADIVTIDREISSIKDENAQLKRENIEIKKYLCGKDPSAVFCR